MVCGRDVGRGGQFFNLRYTYISNMSVLLGLARLEKFVVMVGGGGWVVCKPILVFSLSLSKAEQ